MIKKGFYMTREDGVKLYKTYSTSGYKIRKLGTDEVYDEAIDVENANYVYVETADKVENDEGNETDIVSNVD